MLFSSILHRLVELAASLEDARSQYAAIFCRDTPVVASGGEPLWPLLPEKETFRSYCNGLSPDQIFMAASVMYLGRELSLERASIDIHKYNKQTRANLQRPEWAVNQMLEKAPLRDYFERGIRTLIETNVDIDSLVQD